jgi:uncharacterized protein (DUF1684 family)
LSSDPIEKFLSLADWRRRVAEIYAQVRALIARDPAAAHEYWRDSRDDLFRNHPQSPLSRDARASFGGLKYFDYDERLAFVAKLRRLPKTPHDLFTSDGRTMAFDRIAVVDLPIGTLDVLWLDGYAGGLFLSFRDASAGKTTYGGGRYVLDTAKGADLGARGDHLIVDFNFSFNPSCAYDSQWSCPLAPAANILTVAIEAGERA